MSCSSKFIFFHEENIPCWYELSFDEKTLAIIVRLHKDFVEFCLSIKEGSFVESFMKEFKFSSFNGNLTKGNFGFEESFKRMGEENNFVVFSVPIPALEKIRMKTCGYCQGHKKDMLFGEDCTKCNATGQESRMKICASCDNGRSFSGEDCRWCEGRGQAVDSYMDWNRLFAISATVTLFFEFASFGQYTDKIITSKFPQLILVNTTTAKGMHGGSLDGAYSIPLVNWLTSLTINKQIEEVVSAMVQTCKKIKGRFDDFDEINTWARVSNSYGCLHINCPGDRSGLYPSLLGNIAYGRGYQFSCHNVDSPDQQLTLLAGLGALCDKARKEIKNIN